jgi:hypothetical protein
MAAVSVLLLPGCMVRIVTLTVAYSKYKLHSLLISLPVHKCSPFLYRLVIYRWDNISWLAAGGRARRPLTRGPGCTRWPLLEQQQQPPTTMLDRRSSETYRSDTVQ